MDLGRAAALLFVFIGLALAGCVDGEPQLEEVPPEAVTTAETGSIDGTVITDEYFPISGAVATLFGSDTSQETGEDGRFIFNELEPGDYNLIVVRIGYYQTAKSVTVKPAQVSKVEVTLERVPVADPPFDEYYKFYGNVTTGTASSNGDCGNDGIDRAEIVLTIKDKTEGGTELAAVYVGLAMEPAEEAGPHEAHDIELFFSDPDGSVLAGSTNFGPVEQLEWSKYMPGGDYIIRVCHYEGLPTYFQIDAVVTYEQGERAEKVRKE